MSEVKTKPTDADVHAFIDTIEDETKKQDSLTLVDMYTNVTGEPPVMWGASIIGFGKYHYKSQRSSQEADWMLAGFSPRKQNLTLYFTLGFERYAKELEGLGKFKTSKGCLYINTLSDVDEKVLAALLKTAYADAKQQLA